MNRRFKQALYELATLPEEEQEAYAEVLIELFNRDAVHVE